MVLDFEDWAVGGADVFLDADTDVDVPVGDVDADRRVAKALETVEDDVVDSDAVEAAATAWSWSGIVVPWVTEPSRVKVGFDGSEQQSVALLSGWQQ